MSRRNVDLSIEQASDICGVTVPTLRYWERQFSPFLKPKRTVGNQRRYGTDDIALILKIKHLLRDELYSAEGVLRKLRRGS